MKKIKITRNKFAKVDDEDYEKLNAYKWFAYPCKKDYEDCYAARNLKIAQNNYKTFGMHREIMGEKQGMVIDHIDGDKLNNQKNNLRFCTIAENVRNCKVYKSNTSGYKGVHWNTKKKRWTARVRLNGKTVFSRMFKEKLDAITAYNLKSKEYFGEFARINKL